MPLEKLDHVNLRTAQLDAMVDWYTNVLGMRRGERPEFPFPGAWMYLGDAICVHLVSVDDHPGVGSETDLKLEHFAFRGTDRAEFEAGLKRSGERFKCAEISSLSLIQYNIWDPDGNHIHVDFSSIE